MNYLGEIMLYAAYAVLAQSTLYWGVLLYVWCLMFAGNMIRKEVSLRKKPGFAEYEKNSGMLFPNIFGASESPAVQSKPELKSK